jgi:hypothetical protein
MRPLARRLELAQPGRRAWGADFLTWHEGTNGAWAKVVPDGAREELSARAIENAKLSNHT